jgi:microcystin-dependent protein
MGTYYMWAGDTNPSASSFSIVQNRSTKKIVVKADAGTTPVGSINMWATQNFPLGWILCNGAAITYAQYPELYVTLGGVSPYTATITVPDMRGRFPLGASSGSMPGGRLVKALGSAPQDAYTHNHTTSLAHGHLDNISVNAHNHSDNFATNNHNHSSNINATAGATSTTTATGSSFLFSGAAGTYRFHTHAINGNVLSNNTTNQGGSISGNVSTNSTANQGGNISGSVTDQAATSTSTASQTEILPPYIPIHYIIYTGVI